MSVQKFSDRPGAAGNDCALVLAAVSPEADAGAAALRGLEARVRASYPGLPLHWAFTGKPRRARGLREVLAALRGAGAGRVAVQPLHCIPGQEHAELMEEARMLCRTMGFTALRVGAPLLEDAAAARLLATLMSEHAQRVAEPDEATVWVGHGTEHAGRAHYEELGLLLRDKAPCVLITTLKAGERGVTAVAAELAVRRLKRALLLPFFALPGPRSLRDLAGEDRHSWRSRLEAAGVGCRTRRSGMVEEAAFASVWLRRLDAALLRVRSDGAQGAG